MHLKRDNIEITIKNKPGEVIEELFQSLIFKNQIGLETLMKGSDLIFDCVHLLYYKCNKINFKRSGLNIDSPDWIKNKKETINPINKKDNKYFQYTATFALNYEKTGKSLEKIVLNVLYDKILSTFQNKTRSVKNKLFF